MRKVTIILITLYIGVLPVCGQINKDLIIEKMNSLHYMTGIWSGVGWVLGQEGKIMEFNQTENIRYQLDETILLIEGIGKEQETNAVTFEALGIITYDASTGQYTIRSYISSGQFTDAKAHFEGDNFIWTFSTPAGKIKYTHHITDEIHWKETGEFSSDGTKWNKFFEMNLEKQTK